MRQINVASMITDRWRSTATLAIAIALTSIMVVSSSLSSPGRSQAGGGTLGLLPDSGLPGASVTATGQGWTYSVNSPYIIYWESKGGVMLGEFTPNQAGGWNEKVNIPGNATAGGHQIVACEGVGGSFQVCESVGVTVLATPTDTPTPSPRTLDLSPPSGLPGTSVTVTGEGGWLFSVNPPYQIFWDTKGGVMLDDFVVDFDGTWDEKVIVPESASPGGHQIVACEGVGGDFQICLSEGFTVLATATDTPPPAVIPTDPAATSTPTSPTDTPMPAATSTPTTGPGGLVGDANCSGSVNAIDAAIILQFAAGLLESLPCPANADVNSDGNVNSIDAALVLQFAAGLLSSLP